MEALAANEGEGRNPITCARPDIEGYFPIECNRRCMNHGNEKKRLLAFFLSSVLLAPVPGADGALTGSENGAGLVGWEALPPDTYPDTSSYLPSSDGRCVYTCTAYTFWPWKLSRRGEKEREKFAFAMHTNVLMMWVLDGSGVICGQSREGQRGDLEHLLICGWK